MSAPQYRQRKLPERGAAGAYGSGFATSSNPHGARIERESHAGGAAGSPLASLTDEQREEINEAVSFPASIPHESKRQRGDNIKGQGLKE